MDVSVCRFFLIWTECQLKNLRAENKNICFRWQPAGHSNSAETPGLRCGAPNFKDFNACKKCINVAQPPVDYIICDIAYDRIEKMFETWFQNAFEHVKNSHMI